MTSQEDGEGRQGADPLQLTTETAAAPDVPSSGPERVESLVNVLLVSPALAEGTEAHARRAALAEASRTDRAALAGLAAEQPWLTPARPFVCGAHLVTDGLHALTGGPELEIANVPGPFVRAAADLLNAMANFVVTNGGTLEPCQVIALDEENTVLVLDGLPAAGDAAAGVAGGESRPPTLRLAFLT